MFIKRLVVGPLEVNCYLLADGNGLSLVIDPGDEPDLIMDVIRSNGFNVQYIVCTHGHFDHVGAVAELKDETGAKVLIHREELEIYHAARDMAAFWGYDVDNPPEPDVFINDGDDIRIGEISFRVIHAPGHSPGGICLYSKGIVITGDTLFAGSVGRTDFYGGDINQLKESFNKLMLLPEDTRVLPGHGPESTIGEEKRENPFAFELGI